MLEIEMKPAQPWNAFKVAFIGGTYDTRIETGEEYETRTLADIFALLPDRKSKMAGPAFIPSTYHEYDARKHEAQRSQGRFVALTADVDSGDHSPGVIQKAATAFVGDAAYLIYSSPHSRPGDRRWRVVVPLASPVGFENWHDAQSAFFAFLLSRGIATDKALDRSGQLVFLPNVPDVHEKSGTALRGDDGEPLYFQRHATSIDRPGLTLDAGLIAEGMAEIRRRRAEDEREIERMREEAMRRRANRPRGDETSLMDDFNAANSVAAMLEMCGYTQSPVKSVDWRSPYQTSESYATRIIEDGWYSLSQSDADAGVGKRCSGQKGGCFGDAYDLYVHYKHGGDHKAAYRALGAERRASNVIHPPKFNPPEWMAEIPMPEEAPEWYGQEEGAVPDYEAFAAPAPAQGQKPDTLPFEWAGQAAPVLDGLWLIDDWLPKTGIAAVYGHPGSGKSFFVLDMAAAVASGQEWAGKHVEHGLVVYVVAEGQTGFRNRLYAMQQAGRIAPDAPFVFIPCPIDMQAPDGDLQSLMETIHKVAEQAGVPIAMLVIDTLSKTFGAGKENTDDMASYVANCQRVSSAFDCLTAVVHHRPKDSESRDLRGHSSLRGGIETTILVEAGDIKTATTLKQKDGEDNMVVRFKLERVVIGEDKRGKEISTCLTEIVEGSEAAVQKDPRDSRKARLTGHKKTALRAIEDAIAASGTEPPADIPSELIDRYRTWKAANAEDVSERLKNEFYALEDGDETKRRDTARRYANRALKELKSASIIGTWGEWIWVN